MLRFGEITEIDATAGLVRVNFAEEETISPWLHVLAARTQSDKFSRFPDVGDQVAVMMEANARNGVVLGAVYSEADTLPAALQDENVEGVIYDDGTEITYDRSTSKLTADVAGDVDIISAGTVTIDGATEVDAKVGTVEVKITTSGVTIKNGGISLKTILTDFVNANIAETHPTAVGPTGPPVNVASYTALLAQINALFQA